MPNSVAFFPWVTIQQELKVGPLRLVPYKRGKLPGDQPDAPQAVIDGVLRAYAVRKTELVPQATLVEFGEWRLGQDADRDVGSKLFRLRELIAFAALAKRRLFHGHSDYSNFDTYAFVIQQYDGARPGAFSFDCRRRDGGANHYWTADEFAFLKPLHVASHARMEFDCAFLEAEMNADDNGSLPYEAIVEFNRANSGSPDVPTHTEVVLTKSAFEYLFDIGQGVPEFVNALQIVVSERKSDDTPKGPLESRWKEARPKAARPLEAWAREFCDLRGGAAHGQKRGGGRFVWSEQAHLAFASILFPLLVKYTVAKSGAFALPERDQVELERIEDYLMHDPFAAPYKDETEDEDPHPWNRVFARVQSEILGRGLLQEMQKIDWANLAKE